MRFESIPEHVMGEHSQSPNKVLGS
jgi:hypothetical protein